MSELRKDYIFDRWVIISEKRAKRPQQFSQAKLKYTNKKVEKSCAFCVGNENLTAKETFRIGNNKIWCIRAFRNLFPAVEPKNFTKIKTKNGIITFTNAYGYHEIIVDSNSHSKQLHDLPASHIKDLLTVFIQRIKELSKDKKIKYVTIFKNHMKEAGTSIIHSHCQLLAYNQFPTKMNHEIGSFNKFKSCQFCKVIKLESRSKRLRFKNRTFMAFAPFASQYPYEIEIMPLKHKSNILELNESELIDLADLIKKAIYKLSKIKAPYNLYLHNFPKSKKSHFHVKIAPRMNINGGFELETGTIINTVFPEKAAKFYRK